MIINAIKRWWNGAGARPKVEMPQLDIELQYAVRVRDGGESLSIQLDSSQGGKHCYRDVFLRYVVNVDAVNAWKHGNLESWHFKIWIMGHNRPIGITAPMTNKPSEQEHFRMVLSEVRALVIQHVNHYLETHK